MTVVCVLLIFVIDGYVSGHNESDCVFSGKPGAQ